MGRARAPAEFPRALHLIKLAAGCATWRTWPRFRPTGRRRDPPLRFQTRNTPKRGAELCDGGSLYWVIGGVVQVRQRILDVIPDVKDDGTKCCAVVLDPALVRVAGQSKKAFQGWRYFMPADAPPDLDASPQGGADMPEEMRRALAGLGLI